MSDLLAVAAKEAREMVRDRRVLAGTLLGPALLVAVFVMLIGAVERSVSEGTTIPVAVVGDWSLEIPKKADSIQFVPVSDEDEGVRQLRGGEVEVVVVSRPAPDGRSVLRVVYDPADTLSRLALSAIERAVEEANRSSATGILRDLGVPEERFAPASVEAVPDRKPEGLGASSVASMIPYLVVLWAFYGVISSVTDMFAGEKERGTLEALLTTPARRRDLALGKTFALFLLSLATAAATLLAVLAVGASGLDLVRVAFPEPPRISLPGVAMLAAAVVPFAAFCAALASSVAVAARSVREAQTNLTLVSFAIVVPAVYSQFVGIVGGTGGGWLAWTPVLSTAVAIRDALLDRVSWSAVVPGATVHAALAALLAFVVVRAFESDRLLAKG
jgi:sodium transport system permease protein